MRRRPSKDSGGWGIGAQPFSADRLEIQLGPKWNVTPCSWTAIVAYVIVWHNGYDRG